MEAITLYDEAALSGMSPSVVSRRKASAMEEQAQLWIEQARALGQAGDAAAAVQVLLTARARAPDQPEVSQELSRQLEAMLTQVRAQAAGGAREQAWRSLQHLREVWPDAPGAAVLEAEIASDWTMELLEISRQHERQGALALALFDWAVMASLNPADQDIAGELRSLRARVRESLSTPVALFVSMMAPAGEVAPETAELMQGLVEILSRGQLAVPGIRWEERAWGAPGASVTLKVVGEVAADDLTKGPGVYKLPRGTHRGPNPEYVALASRIETLQRELEQSAAEIDEAEIALRQAGEASRANVAATLDEVRRRYNRISTELATLTQRLESLPTTVEQTLYDEIPAVDQIHIHRVEVILQVETSGLTLPSSTPSPLYLTGVAEEKDLVRPPDPERGVPEDPLEFAVSHQELRSQALAHALRQLTDLLGAISEERAQRELLKARQAQEKGDEAAARTGWVQYLLLSGGEPPADGVHFVQGRGISSPATLRAVP